MKYKAVLFDLDGTLLDTALDIMNACNHTLKKYGYKALDEKLLRTKVTAGMREMLKLGIPKEEHQSIFDKYYRVARHENSNVNGLGVGLFLVKKIVDRYKGSIEVWSGKKGVSFKIILPDES